MRGSENRLPPGFGLLATTRHAEEEHPSCRSLGVAAEQREALGRGLLPYEFLL